jgi:two-component system, NtrC family, response regulator HupR/HoxA
MGLKHMHPAAEYQFDYIVGKSQIMQHIFEKTRKIAQHNVPVLIEGESGTGKELIARAIHYNSPRRDKEFVVINCSAFSDSLLESELFGHLKGSFTGAINEKPGLFEFADNGTFFLDEIADMSPALQVKLLRVLQEGTFLKVGGIHPTQVNVRILAATNKNLKKLVDEGTFREDLYYRINVTSINLPPLRDRREDIGLLVDHFLSLIAQKSESQKLVVAEEVLQLLRQYGWPGNIRQLENEIERAAIFSHEGVIDTRSLSPEIIEFEPDVDDFGIEDGLGLNEIKKRVVEKLERRLILDGLSRTDWNKTECAKLLQVSRGDLMRKIAKYSINRDK